MSIKSVELTIFFFLVNSRTGVSSIIILFKTSGTEFEKNHKFNFGEFVIPWCENKVKRRQNKLKFKLKIMS